MSEAPERIWMDPDIKFPECEKQYGCDVEYVRAYRVEELEAKLKKTLGALGDIFNGEPEWPDDPDKELSWCRNRAREAYAELTGSKDE